TVAGGAGRGPGGWAGAAADAPGVPPHVPHGHAALGPEGAKLGHGGTGGGGIPDLDARPAPFRTVMEAAYGHGVADVFLYAA
ncbi:hypothetical protein, partial [Streptomyces flavovirens]